MRRSCSDLYGNQPATWIRADGCSRWLRTARMSWLVLAAQKVAPSVQTIEDAKRDKLVQADIEGQ